jgi:hypothetical protein
VVPCSALGMRDSGPGLFSRRSASGSASRKAPCGTRPSVTAYPVQGRQPTQLPLRANDRETSESEEFSLGAQD